MNTTLHNKAKDLHACRVLVIRPAKQAQALCRALTALGATPIPFPTLAIKPLPVSDLSPRLSQADFVIFISQNAVDCAGPALDACPSTGAILAVGAATAQALHDRGVRDVVIPPKPPYNSQRLLELGCLQDLVGKRCVIIKGVGGKTELATSLVARGAQVETIDVYQRELPQYAPELALALWVEQSVDVVLATSKDCLENLLILISPQQQEQLLATPIVVISPNLHELALKDGFSTVILADGADTPALIAALLEWRNR